MTLWIIMTVFGHNSDVIRTPEEFHEAIKYGYKVSLHHSTMMWLVCRWRVCRLLVLETRDNVTTVVKQRIKLREFERWLSSCVKKWRLTSLKITLFEIWKKLISACYLTKKCNNFESAKFWDNVRLYVRISNYELAEAESYFLQKGCYFATFNRDLMF